MKQNPSIVLVLVAIVLRVSQQYGQFCSASGLCNPCYYRCGSCSGVGHHQCTECVPEYVLTLYHTCIPCAPNCKSCAMPTSTAMDYNAPLRCETCQPGYYLSQALGTCLLCSTGASQCTLSSIQSCKNKYYYSNGICLACISNCETCTADSASSCQQCSPGYYLTPSGSQMLCSACSITNCQLCDSATDCLQCMMGYGGAQCTQISKCGPKCQICDQQVCYLCSANYFLDPLSGQCMPLGVLCKSVGADVSRCAQCMGGYAYMGQDGKTCVPYYTVQDTYTQSYLTAINNVQYFALTSPSATAPVYRTCSFGNLNISYVANDGTSDIEVSIQQSQPIFGINLIGRVVLSQQSANTSINMAVSGQPAFGTYSQPLDSTSLPCSSSNGTSFVYHIHYEIDLNDSFNISTSYSADNVTHGIRILFTCQLCQSLNITFGIVQLLVHFKHCNVQNCQVCRSPYSCSHCRHPYLLQDNTCVTQCSSGYYTTQTDSVRACTIECADGYYTVLQDYSCLPCQPPCLYCLGPLPDQCINCMPGYYLQNDTMCVQSCSLGHYTLQLKSNYGICDECIYPCRSCANDSKSCTSCLSGYLVQDGSYCTPFCPAFTYPTQAPDGQVCVPCAMPCLQCSAISICITCATGYYYYQASCLIQCPTGTASIITLSNGNQIGVCQPCAHPCLQCAQSSIKCTVCSVGYLQVSGNTSQCSQTCAVGTYGNQTLRQCMACIYPCIECGGTSTCYKCAGNSSTYLFRQECVPVCPNITYPTTTQDISTCHECVPPCSTCSSLSQCLSCTSSIFVLYNGSCLLSCPPSTHLSIVLGTTMCSPCSPRCLSCMSSSECLVCLDRYYLMAQTGACSSACPSTTYPHESLRECMPCRSPCLSCQRIGRCTSCVDGYLLSPSDHKCYGECPSGYYQDISSSTCLECDASCLKCQNNSTSCTQCSMGYYRQPSQSQSNTSQPQYASCLRSCPAYYYAEPPLKICLGCQPPCLLCDSRRSCLSCLPEMPYLMQHQCQSQCPSGTYANTGTNTCQSCSTECRTCNGLPNNCSSCNGQYYLMQPSQSANNTGWCYDSCPDGYYGHESYMCFACQAPCLACRDSMDMCISCIGALVLYGATCLDACPLGYYQPSNTTACQRCSLQCATCQSTPTNCTSCHYTNHYLFYSSGSSSNGCVQSCPPGYFADSVIRSCKTCQPLCMECKAEGVCTKCSTSLVLVSHSCLTECPSKFYRDNGTHACVQCSSPCLHCTSQSECLSCMKPFYYFNQQYNSALNTTLPLCIATCPASTYPFVATTDSQECLLCPDECLQCYDYSACRSCKSGSARPYLQEKKCLAACTQGFYLQNDRFSCSPCSDKCIKCNSSIACSICVNSYLYEGKCVPNCPHRYYEDSTGVCLDCNLPCQNCYDHSNCITCAQGYYLYQTFCLQHCPKDMWTHPHNRTCQYTCDLPYRDTYNMICYIKCPKYFKHDGECVDECSDIGVSQVLNMSLGCQKCGQKCPKTPYFRTEYINKGNSQLVMMIFSQNIAKWDQFSVKHTNYSINRQKILNQQLNIDPSVSAQSPNSQSISTSRRLLQIVKHNPNKVDLYSDRRIILQIDFLSSNQASGKLKQEIAQEALLNLNYNGYPLQNSISSSDIGSTFKSNFNYDWVMYVGYFSSISLWVFVAVNLFLDNCKALFLPIQIMQSVHLLAYLNVWFHPILQNFMRGLGLSAFYFDIIPNLSTSSSFFSDFSNIWYCNIKKILYLNACNYKSNAFSILIVTIALVMITGIGKFVVSQFNPDRHKICWNHINNFYWTFAFVLFFAAYDAPVYVFAPIACALGLLTILIWYQSIKNIFTITYAESTFFWALKKGKSANPLSNSNYPMAMCRRLIITIFICTRPREPISILSLTLFNTILIAVNGIWNKPYKMHAIVLPSIQLLFAAFLLLLEIAIVNMRSVQTAIWEVLSWICFIILIIIIGLCGWISSQETIKIMKINFTKYKETKQQITNQVNDGKNIQHPNQEKSNNHNEQKNDQKQKNLLCEAKNSKASSQSDATAIKNKKTLIKKLNSKNSKKSHQNSKDFNQSDGQQSNDKQINSYFDQSSKNEQDWQSSFSIKPKKDGPAQYLVKINKYLIDNPNQKNHIHKQQHQIKKVFQ